MDSNLQMAQSRRAVCDTGGGPLKPGLGLSGDVHTSRTLVRRKKAGDRRDFPRLFRRDSNLKEIHSRLVTSDLAPSFRFIHDRPSKGSKSSERDKGDPGQE